MTKVRKAKNVKPHPDHWEINETLNIEGRLPLVVGREFRVRGELGRFRFRRHVVNTLTGDEWVDAVHIHPEKSQARSFSPERIRIVHRKIHGRPSDA